MIKKIYFIACSLFFSAVLSAAVLVKNGKAESCIVVPSKPQPSVTVAAEELVHHIKKASGAKLAVYNEDKIPANAPATRIYLGDCDFVKQQKINTNKLKPAEYLIRSTDKFLIITGRDRDTGPVGSSWHAVWHGTLWGVYELLEQELGVRWIWPGELGEVVPANKDIIIGKKELRAAPKLRFTDLTARRAKYTQVLWTKPENEARYWEAQSRFLLRHRIGSVVNMNYSHEFGTWWKKYGKTHPEFFALTNAGTRGLLPETPDWATNFVDMCLSNPNFHKQIIVEWENRPKRTKMLRPYLGVGLNDFPIMCICKNCRSWDQKDHRFATSPYWGKGKVLTFKERWAVAKASWGEEGTTDDDIPSLSDRHARFLLAVQKEAAKKHPGVPVVSFAYANYRKPPVEVKLNDGIIILNTAALFFPYTEKTSREFRKEWIGWKNSGVLQHYRPNLLHAGANLPVFYAKRFADDFNFAYRNGMISSQMDSLVGMWGSQGPNLYTVVRMHSDPERNAESILDDFYNCFGPAAKEVKAYFQIWENRSEEVTEEMWSVWQKRNRTATGLGGTFKNFIAIGAEYMTPEVVAMAEKQLAKAAAAAKGDTLASARVEFLAKGLKEAKLAVEVRKAQIKMEQAKTPESKKAFRAAWEKMNNYRKAIEGDFVIDLGKLRFRESTGLRWPKK